MFPCHNVFKYATVCSLLQTEVRSWLPQLDYLATHTSISPIRCGFAPGFLNYKQEGTRLAAQVIKFTTSCLPMVGGIPASSTTKRGRLDIAGILLKVALIHNKSLSQTPFQDGSVAIIRQSVNMSVRYSDSPLVPQSDSSIVRQ